MHNFHCDDLRWFANFYIYNALGVYISGMSIFIDSILKYNKVLKKKYQVW